MFPWSEKSKKSVTFNQDVADQSLLEVVENELMKQPQKTFSDLCKEALWQFLCVPESVRPTSRMGNGEPQAPDLQRQLTEFEERLVARESSRLDTIERQLNQLSQQLAQVAYTVTHQPKATPAPPLHSETVNSETVDSKAEAETPAILQEVDPLLSRLSTLVDDF